MGGERSKQVCYITGRNLAAKQYAVWHDWPPYNDREMYLSCGDTGLFYTNKKLVNSIQKVKGENSGSNRW